MAPTLAFMQIIAAVSEVEFRVGGEIRLAWSWCSFHSPASYTRILFDFKLQPPYKKWIYRWIRLGWMRYQRNSFRQKQVDARMANFLSVRQYVERVKIRPR